ncbi:MAG: DUF1573 domain-containing protein [Planctomycetes bacterium]|nr:DUF1573 domain-containing protein [Planctomycetota bacterium]
MLEQLINRRLTAIVAAALVAAGTVGTLLAKPPTPANTKDQTPPHLRASTTQPAVNNKTAAKPQPPAPPQATVQLKPGEEPKIEFDTPIYDAGRLRTGVDIQHDFWFHNTGTGPLEIIQVKPSCGCTTSGEYDRIVEPGKSGKIPLKVATGNFSGPISKSVTVLTNAPGAASTIALQIKGELWQMVQAAPSSALFGNTSSTTARESTLTRKITITNNSESPLTLASPKSSNNAFSAEIKPLEEGKKWELTVALSQELPNGAVTGNIEIETGLKDIPKITIPCNAYLVSDVDVVPNKVAIPETRTVPMQRDFYVRNNAAKPLAIADLASSNPALKLTMQETQPGMAYRVTMEVPPDAKLSKDGETVTFSTNNPAYAKMTIPVTLGPGVPVVANGAPVPAMAPPVQNPSAMQPASGKPAGK